MRTSFQYSLRTGSWQIPAWQCMAILVMTGGAAILPVMAAGPDNVHRLDPVDIHGSNAIGLALNGDRMSVLSRGGQVADGASGIAITGEQALIRLEQPFDSRGHNTCGICVHGNAASLSGAGIGAVDNAASGIHIVGNEAYISQNVRLPLPARTGGKVSGGGTGIWISGGRALMDLRDPLTVEGAGSRGVLLKGRSSRVYRASGDMQVLNGATGIEGLGELVWITLQAGALSVSGDGSTGVVLQGDHAMFDTRPGSTLDVARGAAGLRLAGSHARASLAGRIMVAAGATAVQVGGGARAVNEYGASLVTRGPGACGMVGEGDSAASMPVLVNQGRIDIDPAFHEAGQPWPDLPALGLAAHELGFGLSVSTPLVRAGTDQISAVNEGSIAVRNAGAGMVASRPGASVTNRGVISLWTNKDAPPAYGGLLYGMVALNGGSAINDDIGVIEVNTAYGKAFFADSGSTLVNRGTVRLYGSQMAENHAQLGLPAPQKMAPVGHRGLVINSSPRDLAGSRVIIAGIDQNMDRLLNTSELSNGSVLVGKEGSFTNEGTFDRVRLVAAGSVSNSDGATMTLSAGKASSASASFINSGTIKLTQRLKVTGVLVNQSGGKLLLSHAGSIRYGHGGSFVNHSIVSADQAGSHGHAIYVANRGNGVGSNTGALIARGGYGVMTTSGSLGRAASPVTGPESGSGERGIFINQGLIDFTADKRTTSALHVRGHAGQDLLNEHGGVIAVRGDKAVAMRSDSDSQLVNRGIINLGEKGTNDTGMTAMMLRGNAAGAAIVNDTSGIINIYARRSHAFELPRGSGVLINRGLVRLLCGNGSCGVFRNADTRARDISGTPAAAAYQLSLRFQEHTAGHERRVTRSLLAGYVIGTRPDGGAGTLSGSHLDASGVTVDTGFAAGTTARQASFAKVLRGERIDGIEQIRSRSAAWRAQAYRDADGDVGVTLTKHDYRDLVPQASLRPVAAALERGYDGGELFRSLELGSAAAIGQALHQLSGAGIASTLKPLRTLEQRFVRLEHDMPENRAGFGLRLVGSRHGQPEARLGSSSYDLVALRQRFEFGRHARLTAHYGFASVKPGRHAADAGLDGHSQLFGLHYTQVLGRGPTLEGAFRYAQHRIETRRTLRYGDVDLRPQASQRRDQFSHRLALVLPPLPIGGLALEPLFGLALRHQHDAALTERDAGAYALRLSASHDSAVEGVFGLRFRYDATERRSGRGWRADAELQGRPTLYRQAGVREIRFVTAPGARFSRTETGDRFGYEARLGLRHQGRWHQFELGAYAGDEQGERDRGVSVRYLHAF